MTGVYRRIIRVVKKPRDICLPANILTAKAKSVLKAQKKKPFFMWMHYLDAHTPYLAPRKFIPSYISDADIARLCDVNRVLKNELTPENIEKIIDLYIATIKYVFSEINELFAYLKKDGRLKNTVVIISADHGDECMDHGRMSHSASLYDELVHIPFIVINNPLKIKSELISQIDLPKFILNIFKTKNRGYYNFEGIDITAEERDYVLLEVMHKGYACSEDGTGWLKRAVRTAGWKYIIDYEKNEEELYDLKSDPKEKFNLAKAPELAHIKNKLKKLLKQHAQRQKATQELARTVSELSV